MNIRLLLASLPICILCYTFALVMPDTALWRDTGEFILSSFFLDISHPAGFPLLTMLSNFFALLPLGPIAWRVHTANLFFCIVSLILAYRLSFYFLRHVTRLDPSLLAYFAAIPPLLLLTVPTFFKQAITAEAYVLNTAGIQLLLLLYLRSEQTKDLRYLVTAAFFAGLFPGNHITIVLAYVPMLVLILLRIKRYARILLPASILSVFGLAVFCYIPARAITNPPLNTGGAYSLKRFANLISNERDRALRVPAAKPDTPTASMRKEQKATLFLLFVKDAKRIAEESSVLLLLFAGVGLAIALVIRPDFGFTALWILLSHWYFFKGWQPDPWIPIFFFIAFFASVLLALLTQTLADLSSKRIAYSCAAVLGACVLFSYTSKATLAARLAVASFTPAHMQQQTLLTLPKNAPLLSERSYFLHSYHTAVEGFRADIVLLYIKQITNPEYFAPFSLYSRGDKLLASKDLTSGGRLENIKAFIDKVAPLRPVAFEPTQGLSQFIAPVASLQDSGIGLIRYRQKGTVEQAVVDTLPQSLGHYRIQIDKSWEPFRWEGQHYIASSADAVGDLLLAKEFYEQSVAYYSTLCQKVPCNPVLKNNLASSLIKAGKAGKAAKILEALLEEDLNRRDFNAVQHNLLIAYEKQKQSSRSTDTSE